MKRLLGVFALAAMVMLTTACPDDGPFEPVEHFTIQGGLAGCDYILQSTGDSAYVLEPLNLTEFIATPVMGQEVWVSYELVPDAASACMMGPIVNLLSVAE